MAERMLGEECPHGSHPSYCVDCQEGVPPEKPNAQWEKVGRVFRAIYDGTCLACGHAILSDAHMIQRWNRENETKYTHQDCGL